MVIALYKAKRREGRLIAASRLTIEDIFQFIYLFIYFYLFIFCIHDSNSKTKLRHGENTSVWPYTLGGVVFQPL